MLSCLPVVDNCLAIQMRAPYSDTLGTRQVCHWTSILSHSIQMYYFTLSSKKGNLDMKQKCTVNILCPCRHTAVPKRYAPS